MTIISPIGKLYGRIMDLRNLLYDRGVLKSYELGARTISVGNLTAGGTGKTPLVALIAKMLIDQGQTVCILTRGYGRKEPGKRVLVSDGKKILTDAATGGDEPVELAQRLGGQAIIVADRNRVAAAEWARDNFAISTFILDDGFQHRRARRDLDIVCVDATDPCGNGRILPAGTLRESLKSIARADVIVITRTEQVVDTKTLQIRLRNQNAGAAIFRANSQLGALVSIEEFHEKAQSTRSTDSALLAFTGIGNPKNFYTSLERESHNVAAAESFPDHHRFTQADVYKIEAKARASNAAALVTTAKDAVKLKGFKFELPCYVAIAETIIDDAEAFKKLIISS